MSSGVQPLETTEPIAKLLKQLKAIDPELRKQFMQNAKAIAKPVESSIKSNLPSVSPLSGAMNNGRLGWNVGKRFDSTTVKFKGTGSKMTSITPLLSVTVNNAAMSMMDMAGRRASGNTGAGRAMISKLNQVRGASRYVYPGGEKALAEAVNALKGIIEDVANYFNRKAD